MALNYVEIHDPKIYPETVDPVIAATPGFEIKATFDIELSAGVVTPRTVWWAIHERNTDTRLKSGTNTLNAGGTLKILRYVTMPDYPIKLEFWTGLVEEDGTWAWTDNCAFNEIVPIVPPPSKIICYMLDTGLSIPSELPITFPAPGISGMPSIDVSTLPVSVDMSALCTQDTSPVTTPSELFPLHPELYVMDNLVKTFDIDSSGHASFDIINNVRSLLSAGSIASTTTSIPIKLRFPYSVELPSKTVTEYREITSWLPLKIPKITTCTVIIPDDAFTVPTEIPLKFPAPGELGSPTLDTGSLPVNVTMFTVPCMQDSTPVSKPSGLMPIPIDLYVLGEKVTTLSRSSEGPFSYDIASFITGKLPSITPDITSIPVKIRFPKRIDFSSPGTIVSYGEIEKSISIKKTFAEIPGVKELLCAITGSLSDIASIPITIPELGGFPSLGVGSIPVDLSLSATCAKDGSNEAVPSGLFSELSAEVFLDSTKITDIYPNSYGNASFDLASFASTLLSGVTGSTSKTLTVRYPSRVKIGSVEVLEYADITKTISLTPEAAPHGGCTEGAFMSPFTCPDGSVINLLKCVGGKWVSSGQSCPPAPECTEGAF
ncbi:MAG: hypothetical protein DRP85_07960, partial [Candidatus Makaraimicrobium thalassicum]